jgi:hypothetical protein
MWPGGIRRICKGPDTIHKPSLDGPTDHGWNISFLLRRYCWGRRVFGISNRGLETEIWVAVQSSSQESDWSSVEGEAAAIIIRSIERSRSYVFCPAKSFLVESILSLSPTHPLYLPNSIASLISLADSF